ncbi:MAG: amidase, partial [Gammaproteobacteria bacterium]|nr:amidase [Gammaproteobacteria bacterium]
SGLRALQALAAQRSAPAVARLEAAGMQCIGKLNMHAVALGATNHNADFGDAFNPERAGYTPGGSSGGSGAAVAAHLCAIALGTDTMGSVRIPASYCGVVGFKPGYDEIPLDGVMPLCRLLDHVGILARSVQDVMAAFACVSDSFVRPGHRAAEAPVTDAVLAIPAQPDALAMSAEVRLAYANALQRLRDHGTTLVEVDLSGYDFGRVRRAGLLLCEAQLLTTLAPTIAARAAELPADLRAMLDFAAGKKPADIARALDTVVAAGHWMRHLLRPFDALLLPTAGQTAFPMNGPVPHDQADFTAMANVAGVPAISLPLPRQPGALPIGLQLIGRRDHDMSLLRLAEHIQPLL